MVSIHLRHFVRVVKEMDSLGSARKGSNPLGVVLCVWLLLLQEAITFLHAARAPCSQFFFDFNPPWVSPAAD